MRTLFILLLGSLTAVWALVACSAIESYSQSPEGSATGILGGIPGSGNVQLDLSAGFLAVRTTGDQSLVGTWQEPIPDRNLLVIRTFGEDGNMEFAAHDAISLVFRTGYRGSYTLENEVLTLVFDTGQTERFSIAIENRRLRATPVE